MLGKLLLAAALLAPLPGAAMAAGDCILDNCADQKPLPQPNPSASPAASPDRPTGPGFGRSGPGPRGASVPGQFDFYVLSLSWSPGFCETGGAKKGRDQCDSGANLGFVVHGLWPQYDHGFPSDCRGQSAPSRIALAATDGVSPDEGLARYEWRKHGTCSGLSPTDYFANAKAARDAIVIPQPFRDAHKDQRWVPVDVERAFIAANPRLRPGMLAAVCQHGVMEEVRICFARDLKSFQACPEVARDRCRAPDMSVPPVR